MYITAALKGKIHRLKGIMCVYRQFADGSWSSKNKSGDERIKFLNQTKKAISLFDEQTNLKYHDLVVNQIESCDFRIAFIKKDFKAI